MARISHHIVSIGAAVCFLSQGAFAGPNWVEEGDAGSNIQTAQPIDSADGQQVTRIFGTITGVALFSGGSADDFEDVYQILVTDPVNLFFSTVGTGTNFQTSLWLFDSDGRGLLGNRIAPDSDFNSVFSDNEGSEMHNFATDETGIVITKPGIYYIAITGFGRQPGSITTVAGSLSPIFFFDHPTEVSGPDGAGGAFPLGGWFGTGQFGSYEVVVEGVGVVPGPAVLPVLALGALAMRRRRRG